MSTGQVRLTLVLRRIRRLALNLIVGSFWIYIILRLLLIEVDRHILMNYMPNYVYILNYRWVLLIIIILFLLSLLRRPKYWPLFIWISFFPLLFPLWEVFKLSLRRWPYLVVFSPVIYEFSKTFIAKAVCYCLCLIACISIIISDNKYIIISCIIVLGGLIAYFVFAALKASLRSNVFSSMSTLMGRFRGFIEAGKLERNQSNLPGNAALPATIQQGNDPRLLLYVVHSSVDQVAQTLKDVARGRAIVLYLVGLWLTLVAQIIILFGFEYFGIHRLDSTAFENTSGANIWSFLGYSLNTFMTGSLSRIFAVNPLAVALSYAELLVFIITIVACFFIITTPLKQQFEGEVERFVDDVQYVADTASARLTRSYNMSIEQIEYVLLYRHLEIVNVLRGFRGQPPLDKPTSSPVLTQDGESSESPNPEQSDPPMAQSGPEEFVD
jgi:hypothetical protein